MLNKIVKNASALLLSLTLLLPVQMLGTTAQETEPKDKIDNILLNAMEYSKEYSDVTVSLIQPDYSDLCQQVNDTFKEYPAWSGIDEDPIPERSELFKKLKNERWREYVDDFMIEVGLSKERMVCVTPLIIWATDEEIHCIEDNDKVICTGFTDYPDEEYLYTTGIALEVLRIAVGAEKADSEQHMRIGGSEWVYDINQDGRITAGDACLALQSAVGHISIGPYDIALQRKARLLEKDALN